jgi:hypothetical protein
VIRTLLLVAAVSFGLAIGFFAGAFAIAGGPFSIDDGWRFRRADLNENIVVEHRSPGVIQASDERR